MRLTEREPRGTGRGALAERLERQLAGFRHGRRVGKGRWRKSDCGGAVGGAAASTIATSRRGKSQEMIPFKANPLGEEGRANGRRGGRVHSATKTQDCRELLYPTGRECFCCAANDTLSSPAFFSHFFQPAVSPNGDELGLSLIPSVP